MNLQTKAYKNALLHRSSVGMEQRQVFKNNNVLSANGVALCQNRHASDDFAAGFLYQLFKSDERCAGADNVVYNQNLFTLQVSGIASVKIQGLVCGCGNGFNSGAYHVLHV